MPLKCNFFAPAAGQHLEFCACLDASCRQAENKKHYIFATAGVNKYFFESFSGWICAKNIKTSRLGVANDSSVFLTTLKHSIVSKISPGAVETTLKIGTNNLQKMLILIGRRRRPKNFGLFPPTFRDPGGEIFFSPPYSETLGGK